LSVVPAVRPRGHGGRAAGVVAADPESDDDDGGGGGGGGGGGNGGGAGSGGGGGEDNGLCGVTIDVSVIAAVVLAPAMIMPGVPNAVVIVPVLIGVPLASGWTQKSTTTEPAVIERTETRLGAMRSLVATSVVKADRNCLRCGVPGPMVSISTSSFIVTFVAPPEPPEASLPTDNGATLVEGLTVRG
jgi:hypothetical protein